MSQQGRKDGTPRVADLDRLFLRGKLLLRRARLGRWLLSVYYRAPGARANGFMDPEVWRGLLEQIYDGRRRGDLSIGKLAV
jgi:hypothetical protein